MTADPAPQPAPRARVDPPEERRRSTFLAAARPQLDRAYRIAGLMLGNATDAEDAVQDALAIAWHSFDALRDVDHFRPWLDRILVNGCRDRLRRRTVVQFVPLDGVPEPAGGDPFATVIARDSVLRYLERLHDDERAIVVLHYWADLPLEAVASTLAIPTGTVKSRLHRALERMRAAEPMEVAR